MHSRRNVLAAALAATAVAATRSASAQTSTSEVTLERNVVYAEINGAQVKLDVCRPPARDTPRTAVILLYGTSWSLGYASRDQLYYAAQDMAANGYVAFNVDYRSLTFTPGENQWPDQLDDVQRADRWIRANADTYGVDPDRIAAYGLSSGGQLAAMLGVRDTRDNSDASLAEYSSRVACVVAVAGAYDLKVPFPSDDDNQIIHDLLGGTIAEVPEAYRDASPIDWVDDATSPFFILQGGRDQDNPPEGARAMVAALQAASVSVVYVEDPDASHFSWTTWNLPAPWTLTFLKLHLQPDL